MMMAHGLDLGVFVSHIGTWFAIEGLSVVGQSYGNSTCIRKACKFLLTKQLKSGGWGESHLSSRTKLENVLE